MEYLILIAGFILLIKGADFFVDGSASVAKRFQVPSLIIGMTIVAMGTSLPECSVSITAAMMHQNGLSISNAVGSNIFNLMVVCGICAVLCPLTVQVSTMKKEFPLSVAAALVMLIFGCTGMRLSRFEGIIMLIFFACFLYGMVRSARKAKAEGKAVEEEEYELMPIWKCILLIVGGAAAIAFGGDMVVDSASVIAASFGMSDTLIGLTIVAFGTSLPELVTSVVAARKDELDMALGNVIGSNIFNILLVVGIAASISPLSFTMENLIDIVVLSIMSVIVWILAWKDKKLIRRHGILMLVIYAGYFGYIFMR